MLAHSLRLVLPRITAPASRSRATRKRVARRASPRRARATRPWCAIRSRGVDVVLDQHRDAVQRSAHPAALALGVERRRRSVSASGLSLDHAVQRRPAAIDRLDAAQIALRHLDRGDMPRSHQRLQITNRVLGCGSNIYARRRSAGTRRTTTRSSARPARPRSPGSMTSRNSRRFMARQYSESIIRSRVWLSFELLGLTGTSQMLSDYTVKTGLFKEAPRAVSNARPAGASAPWVQA